MCADRQQCRPEMFDVACERRQEKAEYWEGEAKKDVSFHDIR